MENSSNISSFANIVTMTTVSPVAMDALLPYRVAVTLWKVVSPVILVLGTVGNVLCLVVFRRMRKGRKSGQAPTVYFSALALSDLALLYLGLLRRWCFYVTGYDVRAVHDVVCKTHLFLVYLTCMTSSWFLVMMTSERLTSVLWPHRVRLLCTDRFAKITVAIVLSLLIILNSPWLVGYEASEQECDIVKDEAWKYFFDDVFTYVDLTMSSLLPAFLLLLGNGVLGLSLLRSTRRARRLTIYPTLPAAAAHPLKPSRERAASSLTVTLLCLSVTYLILTSPVCVYYVFEGNGDITYGDDVYNDAWENLAMAVTNLLWYSNAALNFYVYLLTGSHFRAHCVRLLCPWRAVRPTSARGNVYSLPAVDLTTHRTVAEFSEV